MRERRPPLRAWGQKGLQGSGKETPPGQQGGPHRTQAVTVEGPGALLGQLANGGDTTLPPAVRAAPLGYSELPEFPKASLQV